MNINNKGMVNDLQSVINTQKNIQTANANINRSINITTDEKETQIHTSIDTSNIRYDVNNDEFYNNLRATYEDEESDIIRNKHNDLNRKVNPNAERDYTNVTIYNEGADEEKSTETKFEDEYIDDNIAEYYMNSLNKDNDINTESIDDNFNEVKSVSTKVEKSIDINDDNYQEFQSKEIRSELNKDGSILLEDVVETKTLNIESDDKISSDNFETFSGERYDVLGDDEVDFNGMELIEDKTEKVINDKDNVINSINGIIQRESYEEETFNKSNTYDKIEEITEETAKEINNEDNVISMLMEEMNNNNDNDNNDNLYKNINVEDETSISSYELNTARKIGSNRNSDINNVDDNHVKILKERTLEESINRDKRLKDTKERIFSDPTINSNPFREINQNGYIEDGLDYSLANIMLEYKQMKEKEKESISKIEDKNNELLEKIELLTKELSEKDVIINSYKIEQEEKHKEMVKIIKEETIKEKEEIVAEEIVNQIKEDNQINTEVEYNNKLQEKLLSLQQELENKNKELEDVKDEFKNFKETMNSNTVLDNMNSNDILNDSMNSNNILDDSMKSNNILDDSMKSNDILDDSMELNNILEWKNNEEVEEGNTLPFKTVPVDDIKAKEKLIIEKLISDKPKKNIIRKDIDIESLKDFESKNKVKNEVAKVNIFIKENDDLIDKFFNEEIINKKQVEEERVESKEKNSTLASKKEFEPTEKEIKEFLNNKDVDITEYIDIMDIENLDKEFENL